MVTKESQEQSTVNLVIAQRIFINNEKLIKAPTKESSLRENNNDNFNKINFEELKSKNIVKVDNNNISDINNTSNCYIKKISFVNQNLESNPNLDLHSKSQNICRICYEGETHKILINPCICKGTMKFVHEECVKNWILNQKITDLTHQQCEVCNTEYQIKKTYEYKFSTDKLIFTLKNIASTMFIIFVICLILFLITYLIAGNVFNLNDDQKYMVLSIFLYVTIGIEIIILILYFWNWNKNFYEKILTNWTIVNHSDSEKGVSFNSEQ